MFCCRFLVWIKACHRNDLLNNSINVSRRNLKLCEKHFETKYICQGGPRKQLFRHAVPTIFSYSDELSHIKKENVLSSKCMSFFFIFALLTLFSVYNICIQQCI